MTNLRPILLLLALIAVPNTGWTGDTTMTRPLAPTLGPMFAPAPRAMPLALSSPSAYSGGFCHRYWRFAQVTWTADDPAPAAPPDHYVDVPRSGHEDTSVEDAYSVGERHGWEWIDGYIAEDGTPVEGHWRRTEDGPASYVFVPGAWDGDTWIDGYWLPVEE